VLPLGSASAQLSVLMLNVPQGTLGANFKAINPNTFVYKAKSNYYQFYLSTVGYAPGQYVLTVYSIPNKFAPASVTFTLQ